MKISLEYELFTFFASVVLALIIGVVYDFFRAIRSCIKKTALWDSIMWITVLFFVVSTWFFAFEGQVRWYAVLGSFLTGCIYFLTLSKYVYFSLHFLMDKICSFFRIIFKILLTPFRFLCKIIGVYISKVKVKFSKKVEEDYE